MSARPGLCGGHQVTGVPTAITNNLPGAGRAWAPCTGTYGCAKAKVSATMFASSKTEPFGMSFPRLFMVNWETGAFAISQCHLPLQ